MSIESISGQLESPNGTFSNLVTSLQEYISITALIAHSSLISLSIMPSSPLVLITGGNGFVGYAVLAGILYAGVRVSPEI